MKPVDQHWRKHSMSTVDLATGEVTITYRTVIDQPMNDDVQHVPPVPRVY